jgi:hypothetical protein
MPRGALLPRPGTVTLRVGREIATTGLDYEARDALAQEVRRAMLALGAIE